MSSHTQSAPSKAAATSKASPRLGWIWGLLIVAIVGIGGAVWWLRPAERSAHAAVSPGAPSPDSHDDEVNAVHVEVVQPTPGGITRTSTQVGSVHAYEEADLFAKVSGYLKSLNVDIGDHVKQGEELAVIDDPELVKKRDYYAAVVRQSKAAVKQAEAAILSFEADAEKAAAEVERYTSTRRFREKELARYQDLRRNDAIPQSVVDEEIEHLDSAKSAERAARAAVVSAKAAVDKAKADKLVAEANVVVAQEQLAEAEELVKYLTIKSPYTGVVTARYVHPGDFIRSAADGNQKPLLHVARTDKLRVVTMVPDRDVPYVDIDDHAEIALDALNSTIDGRVWRFADSEDPESRTMRTEVLLDNKDGKVRQGMFGQATIILEQTKAAMSIPAGAINGASKNGEASVFVVRDGKAKLTKIKVGADDGIRVEVVKGLTPSDQVITNVSAVTDGSPVVVARPAKVASAGGH